MRVTPTQIQTIQQQIHRYLGDAATVWLFGSRLDDAQKGGDIDLYVEAGPHRLLDELRYKIDLQDYLDTLALAPASADFASEFSTIVAATQP